MWPVICNAVHARQWVGETFPLCLESCKLNGRVMTELSMAHLTVFAIDVSLAKPAGVCSAMASQECSSRNSSGDRRCVYACPYDMVFCFQCCLADGESRYARYEGNIVRWFQNDTLCIPRLRRMVDPTFHKYQLCNFALQRSDANGRTPADPPTKGWSLHHHHPSCVDSRRYSFSSVGTIVTSTTVCIPANFCNSIGLANLISSATFRADSFSHAAAVFAAMLRCAFASIDVGAGRVQRVAETKPYGRPVCFKGFGHTLSPPEP
ncbi:hypothetical protein AC578_4128 [Pseudocercospora eumusae]|uniref:Uncharacterized protein n=1 Tax=Pseudocercospora eumusae TaxID=321146 RepID=A0A139HFD0_9PEZI|nr:hypothetical protein AC578_4128 [Pseudocercospora eumusae]